MAETSSDSEQTEFVHDPWKVREVSSEGVWSVSSCKAGYGVEAVVDGSVETYWQSDGPQPHLLTLSFPRKLHSPSSPSTSTSRPTSPTLPLAWPCASDPLPAISARSHSGLSLPSHSDGTRTHSSIPPDPTDPCEPSSFSSPSYRTTRMDETPTSGKSRSSVRSPPRFRPPLPCLFRPPPFPTPIPTTIPTPKTTNSPASIKTPSSPLLKCVSTLPCAELFSLIVRPHVQVNKMRLYLLKTHA